MNYKEDYKSLIAIISFLATTELKSGTYRGIAKDTSLDEAEVKRILLQYKEFFVKIPSKGKVKTNSFFTLHFRYGLRREDPEENMRPLPEEYILTLFNFISQRILQEENANKTRNQNVYTMIVASVAAA